MTEYWNTSNYDHFLCLQYKPDINKSQQCYLYSTSLHDTLIKLKQGYNCITPNTSTALLIQPVLIKLDKPIHLLSTSYTNQVQVHEC